MGGGGPDRGEAARDEKQHEAAAASTDEPRGGLNHPRDRLPWPLRLWRRANKPSVADSLTATWLVSLLALTGMIVWFLSEGVESKQSAREVWQNFQIQQYQQRQQAHEDFAEGVPRNLTYLMHMRYKTLWLNGVSQAPKPDEASPRRYNGRSFDEVVDSLEEERRLWLRYCPHYTALCEAVRSRFGPRIGEVVDLLRRSLDALNAVPAQRERQRQLLDAMLGRAKQLQEWMQSARDANGGRLVEPKQLEALRSVIDRMTELRQELAAEKIDADEAGPRLVSLFPLVIDQAYLLGLRRMEQELQKPPVYADNDWIPGF